MRNQPRSRLAPDSERGSCAIGTSAKRHVRKDAPIWKTRQNNLNSATCTFISKTNVSETPGTKSRNISTALRSRELRNSCARERRPPTGTGSRNSAEDSTASARRSACIRGTSARSAANGRRFSKIYCADTSPKTERRARVSARSGSISPSAAATKRSGKNRKTRSERS